MFLYLNFGVRHIFQQISGVVKACYYVPRCIRTKQSLCVLKKISFVLEPQHRVHIFAL